MTQRSVQNAAAAERRRRTEEAAAAEEELRKQVEVARERERAAAVSTCTLTPRTQTFTLALRTQLAAECCSQCVQLTYSSPQEEKERQLQELRVQLSNQRLSAAMQRITGRYSQLGAAFRRLDRDRIGRVTMEDVRKVGIADDAGRDWF